MPRFPARTAALFAGAALLSALAPSAAAAEQATKTSTEVILTPVTEPIRPLSGIGQVSGTVIYTYPANGQTAFVGTTIQLKAVEAPEWAIVTISPSTLVIPLSQGTGLKTSGAVPVERPFKVLVSATAEAPAFTPANIRIQATALDNSPLKGSVGDDSIPIQADFFSILDMRTDAPIQVARPQISLAYPIMLQNFGNANTKVTLNVSSKTPDLQIIVPPPVTLEARQNGGKQTAQQVIVQVQTPHKNGFMNRVGSATIQAHSVYALDVSKKGDSSQLTILTTTKGFYVPGPEPVLALLALAGLAAIRGRARLPGS